MSQQRPKGLKRSRQEKQEASHTEDGEGGSSSSSTPTAAAAAAAAVGGGNKKLRLVETGAGAGEEQEQEELSLVVEGGDDDAETDDFEEAKVVFQSALNFIEQENKAQARTLLNGTIHEFDRMLKEEKHEAIYVADFHQVYAGALRELAMLEESHEILQAAIDRFETALEIDQAHAPSLWGLAKTFAEEV